MAGTTSDTRTTNAFRKCKMAKQAQRHHQALAFLGSRTRSGSLVVSLALHRNPSIHRPPYQKMAVVVGDSYFVVQSLPIPSGAGLIAARQKIPRSMVRLHYVFPTELVLFISDCSIDVFSELAALRTDCGRRSFGCMSRPNLLRTNSRSNHNKLLKGTVPAAGIHSTITVLASRDSVW